MRRLAACCEVARTSFIRRPDSNEPRRYAKHVRHALIDCKIMEGKCIYPSRSTDFCLPFFFKRSEICDFDVFKNSTRQEENNASFIDTFLGKDDS